MKHCPHPVKFSRAAASRVRQLRGNHARNPVHIVLAHLCGELYEPISEQDAREDSDNYDIAIFEEILVSDAHHSMTEPNHAGGDRELEKVETFPIQVKFEPTTDEFWGTCIDSGAQRAAIGQKQAEAYARQVGIDVGVRDNKQGPQKELPLRQRRSRLSRCA